MSDHDTAQRELLGEAGHRQLREFERTADLREGVRGIAAAATIDGIPFTSQQTQQLIGALVAATPGTPGGNRLNTAGTDWAAVDARAREILSPEQFTYFKTIEPPNRGSGGRFHLQWNAALQAAQQAETAGRSALAKPDGG
jgi:hypothetical protein